MLFINPLKVTIIGGYILTFDISVDLHKRAKCNTCKIKYCKQTIMNIMNPAHFIPVKCTKFQNLKNVPANNCHLKVVYNNMKLHV